MKQWNRKKQQQQQKKIHTEMKEYSKKKQKKQNLHPVYIVRTMICSYFGISFFGFAKNVLSTDSIWKKKEMKIYIEKLIMKYK